MRKLSLILCLLIIYFINGQEYRVLYKMSFKPDSTNNSIYSKDMILDIKDNSVKFHSLRMYVSDSIYDAQKSILDENRGRFIDYDHTVIKNFDKNEVVKFYRLSFGNVFKTIVKLPKFNWKINKQIKMINGYNCQNASVQYMGRMWEAWFATEIPLQNGPYVFDGLPGLILHLNDSKNNFIFEFSGLKKYKATDYLKTPFLIVTKDQLKNLYINYYYDPFKELRNAGLKIKNEVNNSEINTSKMAVKHRADLKQFNNPIELTDIIHYPNK